ncbi:hypothetical protein F2Q69_00013771 [Brassica cretica]|uniref:Uncharacterized protein n=1 Tax=Brassica cretica TaxID=69181 RepID=A0A8S9QWH7_BRACR|nr:hypothetical protein F2Q69_00013771 [Brassica cretica]
MTSATPSRARILAMGSGPLRPMPLIAAHYGAASPWVGTNSRAVPWFADFVSSPLPSLFSHLVAAFITARISGGSHFRYVFQSSLFLLFPSFPWYSLRDGSYLLADGCASAYLGMCLSVSW